MTSPTQLIKSFVVPASLSLLALLRWSDVFFQNNISLRSLLPAVLMQKRTVVVHQTWIRNVRGQIDLVARLKRMLLGSVTNVAISRAVAEDIARESLIISNPYRDRLFRVLPETARARKLIFVGRLVSDKGVDLAFARSRNVASRRIGTRHHRGRRRDRNRKIFPPSVANSL